MTPRFGLGEVYKDFLVMGNAAGPTWASQNRCDIHGVDVVCAAFAAKDINKMRVDINININI